MGGCVVYVWVMVGCVIGGVGLCGIYVITFLYLFAFLLPMGCYVTEPIKTMLKKQWRAAEILDQVKFL